MPRKSMFDLCLEHVLKNEGGWVDHPADRGGETYKGIARNFHQGWRGWGIIDELRSRCGDNFPACLDGDDFLQAQVREFYRTVFWVPSGAELIEEFLTARRYFDLAVNAGVSGAARMLQNALRLLGRETGPIDGVVGPVTRTALRAQGAAREGWVRLETALRALQARHYLAIAERDAGQRVFLIGWLRRALF